MNNLAEEYINNKQSRWYIWGTQPVERIVEHYQTIPSGSARYFFVKLDTRSYSEPINLKLLNDLWEKRSNFLIDGEWHDRLHNDKGETIFSVWNDPYWETVYAQQGKHYPRPKRRKSKMRMSKKWRKV